MIKIREASGMDDKNDAQNFFENVFSAGKNSLNFNFNFYQIKSIFNFLGT